MRKICCLTMLLLLLAGASAQTPAGRTLATLPQGFEPNRGQAAQAVDFIARGPGYALALTSDAAHLQLSAAAADGTKRSSNLDLKLMGADPQARADGLQPQASRSNYFIGNDPSGWLTGIPRFGRVQYHAIYPGIDVAYYGNSQKLEYDFILSPHADPAKIRLAIEGADRVAIDSAGDLVLTVGASQMRERKPVIYQDSPRGRSFIAGRYIALGGNRVGFELGAYDRTAPLTIDPVLVFSSFFGSTGLDQALGVTLDAAGNMYICGSAGAGKFTGTDIGSPGFTGSQVAAFVDKISPAGALLSSTFIAGASDTASATGVALDSNDNIYLSGNTSSATFPTLNPIQKTYGGGGDGFALELNNAGSALVYSTYLGGSGGEGTYGIGVDSFANAVITGYTSSKNFPVSNATQATLLGSANAFAVKIAAGGSSLVYSTYYGGSTADYSTGMTLDESGNLIFFGNTSSTNFPLLSPFISHFCGWTSGPVSNPHGWVAKLSPSGVPIYSSYVCGSAAQDGVRAGATDAAGDVYLAGFTGSATFPTLNPIQASFGGGSYDAIVLKLSPAGTLLFSTYLGGSGSDVGRGIALDQLGNFYVTGNTASANFPTVSPTQKTLGGGDDAFLTKYNAANSAMVFSTYLGGSGEEYGYGVAVDSLYNAYIAGSTASANFPTASPFQSTYGGDTDAFIAEISTCAFTLSAQSPFSSAGGTGSVAITTTPECGWVVADNSAWITVNSSTVGQGSGSVSYTVAANTGGSRQGALTIGGQSVTIAQSGPPVLSVTETNAANFTQGENGATYTVVVSNGTGTGPTSGTVQVTQYLPTGLTLVSMAGTGWTCSGAICTRSDVLNPGASYPAVTVTVNVASNASSPLLAQVTASGGGAVSSANGSDNTTIATAGTAVLAVTETNSASFIQGETGATYTVVVSNGATAGPTNSAVSLMQTLPSGLTLVSMAGTGWTCSGATCSRSDVLNPGASYPAVTVTVNVASNASSPQVAQVTVSGGGSASATATDSTIVNAVASLTVAEASAATFSLGQWNAPFTVTVTNAASAGATTGTVTLAETLPSGLTFVSMSGTGWACSGMVCTRGDSLAPGASYPVVTVVVDVSLIASSSVTNMVAVSGGGSATAMASDTVTISPQASASFSLTNQGPDAVQFAGLLLTGESYTDNVGQTTNCPSTIGVGGTCTVNLTFNTGSFIYPADWALFGQFAAADQQLESGPPNPTRLVFMGDSITAFWDSPSPYGEGSLQAVQPFVNRGIAGQTAEQMLVRFWEDAIKLSPAAIHIFGGTNDMGGNTGPETNAEIMDQIESMTILAQANGIKVLIASITPVVDLPGHTWTDRRPNSNIVALDQLIQAYCQQSGAIYVDYYDVLVDPNTGAMNVNLTVDGLHPNTAGYALMVPVAQAALAQLGY